MNTADLHTRLTARSGLPAITATDVEQYVFSPISFWCKHHAPHDKREPTNEYQQYLFEVGRGHQTSVVKESYAGAIEKRFVTEDDGFAMTLELMNQGEQYVKNMPLVCRPNGIEGRPDLLVKTQDAESELGEYRYKVVEIKSARNIQLAHKLQGAMYNRLIGLIQGEEPSEFYIVNRDGDVLTVPMSEVSSELDRVLDKMRSIIGGEVVEPSHGAGRWPWEQYVDQLAADANDVSLLPGVGEATRGLLMEAGYLTVADIAASTEESLVHVKHVKRIGQKTASKMITSARAITQGHPIRRNSTTKLPVAQTSVFFDLEGAEVSSGSEGLGVANYLIGALIRQSGEEARFVPFFADTPDGEEANLRQFFEWASQLTSPIFYHWHHYERTHLTKMAEHYGLPEALIEPTLDNLVDLSPIANSMFAFPAYGEGLKDIAKSLGFRWRQGDVSALTSMALYVNYTRSRSRDIEAKRKILLYNEDDCLATMHIFDWLASQA